MQSLDKMYMPVEGLILTSQPLMGPSHKISLQICLS
jgi:hypothetical protein